MIKDKSKAQVLYDALMFVTDGKKYLIRDICDSLIDADKLKLVSWEINKHLIEQGY